MPIIWISGREGGFHPQGSVVNQYVHAAKLVCLPYDDSQNYEFVCEVASFTADDSHKYDDQTDVMIDALSEVYIKGKRSIRDLL